MFRAEAPQAHGFSAESRAVGAISCSRRSRHERRRTPGRRRAAGYLL